MLQLFRHLHSCSGCFRLERSPGGTGTHWKAPPCHGAHPTRTSARLLLRLQCASLNSIRPLCNGWEQALYFFPQVRDGIVIAGEMPQQASLEKSVKQRIEGASGDERLSSTN